MIDWNDVTSYRKGQKGNVEPSVLKFEIETITITIHRHINYPVTWLLTCRELGLVREDLYTDNFKEAEKKAVQVILDILVKYERLKAVLMKLLE